MTAALLGTNSVIATTTGTTLTLAIPSTVPAGTLLVVTAEKNTALADTSLGATVTGGGAGNTWTKAAQSIRASTHDLSVHYCVASTSMSGNLTITWPTSTNRRAAVLSMWSGCGTLLASSGIFAGANGGISAGPNGSSTTSSATTTAAAAGLVLGHTSIAGAATATPNGATNSLTVSDRTNTGSADRGCAQAHRVETASATQTTAWTLSVSQGWAAAETVFEVLPDAPTDVTSVIVGGAKKTVASYSVIVGGVKKTVTSRSVIIGGVKHPLP